MAGRHRAYILLADGARMRYACVSFPTLAPKPRHEPSETIAIISCANFYRMVFFVGRKNTLFRRPFVSNSSKNTRCSCVCLSICARSASSRVLRLPVKFRFLAPAANVAGLWGSTCVRLSISRVSHHFGETVRDAYPAFACQSLCLAPAGGWAGDVIPAFACHFPVSHARRIPRQSPCVCLSFSDVSRSPFRRLRRFACGPPAEPQRHAEGRCDRLGGLAVGEHGIDAPATVRPPSPGPSFQAVQSRYPRHPRWVDAMPGSDLVVRVAAPDVGEDGRVTSGRFRSVHVYSILLFCGHFKPIQYYAVSLCISTT